MRRQLLHVLAAVVLSSCSGPGDPPVISDGEPNDTFAQATPITPDVPFVGTMSSYSDVDIYRFDVPASGAMVNVQTFDSSGVACSGIDTYLRFYDSTGMQIDADDDSGLAFCEDYVAWYPSGTYYVGLTGLYPATFAYTIRVRIAPPSTESEPNDSIAMADGPYPLGSIVVGSITPAGETDYYAIQNTGGTSAIVTLEVWIGSIGSCPSYDSTLALYNSSGGQVAYDDDSSVALCPVLTYTIPAYTTYFAAVREFGNDGTIPGYLLEISY
jgi:hypothetical protein